MGESTIRSTVETAGERLEGVARIAVLRASALGDFVFGLPALQSLRAAYPAAEIVYLGRPWHRAFLAGRPGPVDRVVALPAHAVDRNASDERRDEALERRRTIERLRAERFDLAVQLHGGGRHSNPFVAALDARVTAGCRTPDAPPLDRTIPYRYYQSEVLRCLEVVGLVGARPVAIEPRLAVTELDRARADAVVPPDRRPLAVLHPGASDPRRRWPAESFALVGDALAAAGARVAVTGGPDEAAIVAAVTGRMRSPALGLAGRLDLRGLTGLLARATVVVSNDTGPLHLALAVGGSTVGIFWCGNLINAGPPFRARHRPHLAWRLDCPVCGLDCTRGRCAHGASFVADVRPADVVADALELLEVGRAARSLEGGRLGGPPVPTVRVGP